MRHECTKASDEGANISSSRPAASCGMGSQGTTHGRGSHVGTFGPHGHNNHTTRAPRTSAPYILVDESNDVPDSPMWQHLALMIR